MKRLLIVACFLIQGGCFGAVDWNAKFAEAAQLYDAGKYPDASSIYREILAGVESADVHFNLGNSYFREGRLGRAIFHFRKAVELHPRDADARFNLNYVRAKAVDRIEPKGNFGALIREKVPLNARELFWGFVSAWALFWLFAGIVLLRPSDSFRYLRLGSGVIAGLLLCLWVLRLSERPYGVVTAEQSQVYSATGRDNVVLFELHRGAEFSILSYEGNWVQLQLDDGKRGWISKQSVILPDSGGA